MYICIERERDISTESAHDFASAPDQVLARRVELIETGGRSGNSELDALGRGQSRHRSWSYANGLLPSVCPSVAGCSRPQNAPNVEGITRRVLSPLSFCKYYTQTHNIIK